MSKNEFLTGFDINDTPVLVNKEKLLNRISVYGLLEINNCYLFIKNIYSELLQLPGGMIEKGETLEQALIREYKEEVNLSIKPQKFLTFTENFFKAPRTNEAFHSFNFIYSVIYIDGEIDLKEKHNNKYFWIPKNNPNKIRIAKNFNFIFNK